MNPERMSGVPCFFGTRVPIQNLFDYVDTGESLEEFLDDFPGVLRSQAHIVIDILATGVRPELLTPPTD